jgi:hypothetical protein
MIDHTHGGTDAGRTAHGDMGDVARWIWCGATGLMAIAALFVAARATNPVGYYGGIGFFVVAFLFIMFHVKRSFDLAEGGGHH